LALREAHENNNSHLHSTKSFVAKKTRGGFC
jgi:hypothetical protein